MASVRSVGMIRFEAVLKMQRIHPADFYNGIMFVFLSNI